MVTDAKDARRAQLLKAWKAVRKEVGPGKRIPILKVAKKAGVSGGLIHNRYPDIAEQIRAENGKSMRVDSGVKRAKLVAARATVSGLRREVADLRDDVAKLASQNLALTLERDELRAIVAASNVLPMRR